MQEGKCRDELLREPLDKLNEALDSGRYAELNCFIHHDSDGLSNPLPLEVCVNLGLAVAYSANPNLELNGDLLIAQKSDVRTRRSDRQRLRRAARRLGMPIPSVATQRLIQLAPHKNSTIHLATAARLVVHSTGRSHYRKQMEMLKLMGLYRSEDFVRDRVDYLRERNPDVFEKIDWWAGNTIKRHSASEAD